MKNPQEIFSEIQLLKKEQKDLKKAYAQELANADQYEETKEKIKELREKKSQIEYTVQGKMGLAYDKLEELKNQIAEKSQMLNDVAMSELMNGKTLSIKDEYNNEYEPVYKISFKKMN